MDAPVVGNPARLRNCQNLANPNKFVHIRIINSMLGLFIPELVTPYQLLEESR